MPSRTIVAQSVPHTALSPRPLLALSSIYITSGILGGYLSREVSIANEKMTSIVPSNPQINMAATNESSDEEFDYRLQGPENFNEWKYRFVEKAIDKGHWLLFNGFVPVVKMPQFIDAIPELAEYANPGRPTVQQAERIGSQIKRHERLRNQYKMQLKRLVGATKFLRKSLTPNIRKTIIPCGCYLRDALRQISKQYGPSPTETGEYVLNKIYKLRLSECADIDDFIRRVQRGQRMIRIFVGRRTMREFIEHCIEDKESGEYSKIIESHLRDNRFWLPNGDIDFALMCTHLLVVEACSGIPLQREGPEIEVEYLDDS